jgi:hypothetical protein
MMKSSLVKLNPGDKIFHKTWDGEREEVTFLDSILTPNGRNDPQLVVLIYVRKENGNILEATSNHFEFLENADYEEFYPSVHMNKL